MLLALVLITASTTALATRVVLMIAFHGSSATGVTTATTIRWSTTATTSTMTIAAAVTTLAVTPTKRRATAATNQQPG